MVEWPVLVAQQAAVSIAIGGVGLQAHLAPGQQFCQPLGGDVGQALTELGGIDADQAHPLECAIDLNAQRVTIGHPGHRCNGTFGTVDRTGLAVSKATTMRRRVARAW